MGRQDDIVKGDGQSAENSPQRHKESKAGRFIITETRNLRKAQIANGMPWRPLALLAVSRYVFPALR